MTGYGDLERAFLPRGSRENQDDFTGVEVMIGPPIEELEVEADFKESLLSKTNLEMETASRTLDVRFERRASGLISHPCYTLREPTVETLQYSLNSHSNLSCEERHAQLLAHINIQGKR